MAELSQLYKSWIYLLACVLRGEKPDGKRLTGIAPQELYKLAESHSMLAVTAMALESAGLNEPHFQQAKTKAMRKLALFDIERGIICGELDKAGIWFCPLKGIILKNDYPSFGMREMTDNDILCDPSRMEDVRDIMEKLGYKCEDFGNHNHDVYSKPPCLEFEMHRSLFKEDEMHDFAGYYGGIFEKLVPSGGHEYRFTDEGFYIYILAHEYKHFSNNGTGLRPLMDIYVYLNAHKDLDWSYIKSELKKLHLTEFETHSRNLAQKVFTDSPLSEDEAEQLLMYLDSAIYGTVDSRFNNLLTKRFEGKDSKGVKAKYFFDRFFLSGEWLKEAYPFFYKHKYLLPALYIYRPIKGLITHPKKIFSDAKKVAKYKTPKHKY